MSPKFAIILPVYNRMLELPAAIASVLQQTCEDFQLIIVDDGSRDASLEVALNAARQDSRIRVASMRTNCGVAKARNFAMTPAESEFVSFLDSDDTFKPDHLASLLGGFQAYPHADIIMTGMEIIGPTRVPDLENPGRMIALGQDDVYSCGGTALRLPLLKAIGGFPERSFGEDTLMIRRALSTGAQLVRLKTQTYVYNRQSADSLVTQHIEWLQSISLR